MDLHNLGLLSPKTLNSESIFNLEGQSMHLLMKCYLDSDKFKLE